jgi:tRNA (guanine37-N1)-methyltransferase
MQFDIITIFPGFFAGIFEHGVVKRAIQAGLLKVAVHDLREFTHDRHRTVDDRPFGGGEGMVLKPEPLVEAVEHLGLAPRAERAGLATPGETVILLSAQGRRFSQNVARELAQAQRVVLLCGRYEGVDERVNELVADQELSIGDYVLSGGELGAAVILDATMRLLPGVLGNDASSDNESFEMSSEQKASGGAGGLLDHPQYTRPAEFRGLTVPEVLSGGNHEQIRRWRREQALRKTLRNRPDLLQAAELSPEERSFLRALEVQSKDSV